MEKITLTVKEAADYAGVSDPTMYNWTNRDDFDALLRVGRKKLIMWERFVAWLERQADASQHLQA